MTAQEKAVAAVHAGDLEELRRLAAEDPSVAEARSEAGVSILLEACYRNRTDMVDALLAVRRTPFDIFEATALDRVERLTEILEGDPAAPGAWSPDGFTPLHLAAFFGRARATRLLLERGAEIGAVARNPMKVQPLHAAMVRGEREVVVALLVAGADPNARQQAGYTPLQAAAHRGATELAELLLSHGADPAAANDEGKTALDLARADGHPETAALLERHQK